MTDLIHHGEGDGHRVNPATCNPPGSRRGFAVGRGRSRYSREPPAPAGGAPTRIVADLAEQATTKRLNTKIILRDQKFQYFVISLPACRDKYSPYTRLSNKEGNMPIDDFKRSLHLLLRTRFQAIGAGLLCLITCFSSVSAHAEGCYPLQLSLAAPAQLVPKESEICGARINLLWGDNKAVWGIDAGLVNGAGKLGGIEIGGLVNQLKGIDETPMRSWGFQAAGLVNTNVKAPFTGIQVAGLVNDHNDASFAGLQAAGLVNDNDRSSFGGIQVALLSNQNFQSEVTGVQLALFNHAQKLNGFQVGLGNGVTAVEGPLDTVLVSLCLVGSLGGAPACAFYEDPKAHQDQIVNGAQLGLLFNVTKDMNGFQISPFLNHASGSMSGIQVAPLLNVAGSMKGMQTGLFNGSDGNAAGLEIGLFNFVQENMSGFQIGAGNFSKNNMAGFQVGAVNFARNDVTGLQIGIINICKNLKGLQIGAINIVRSRFPSSVFFAPIINIGF